MRATPPPQPIRSIPPAHPQRPGIPLSHFRSRRCTHAENNKCHSIHQAAARRSPARPGLWPVLTPLLGQRSRASLVSCRSPPAIPLATQPPASGPLHSVPSAWHTLAAHHPLAQALRGHCRGPCSSGDVSGKSEEASASLTRTRSNGHLYWKTCANATRSATCRTAQVDRCVCACETGGQRGGRACRACILRTPRPPDVGLGAFVSQLQAHPSPRGSSWGL